MHKNRIIIIRIDHKIKRNSPCGRLRQRLVVTGRAKQVQLVRHGARQRPQLRGHGRDERPDVKVAALGVHGQPPLARDILERLLGIVLQLVHEERRRKKKEEGEEERRRKKKKTKKKEEEEERQRTGRHQDSKTYVLVVQSPFFLAVLL